MQSTYKRPTNSGEYSLEYYSRLEETIAKGILGDRATATPVAVITCLLSDLVESCGKVQCLLL